MSIVLIAGLGNPGNRYQDTRHNIGFRVVDSLAGSAEWRLNERFNALVAKATIGQHVCALLKPQTFMNRSGESIGAWLRFFNKSPSSTLVVYDDITLDFARSKLSTGGSAGGHNGIADIQRVIGNEFIRYRIGIGAKPHKEMDLADYVLSRFSTEEEATLTGKMDIYRNQIQTILDEGVTRAMNEINQKQI